MTAGGKDSGLCGPGEQQPVGDGDSMHCGGEEKSKCGYVASASQAQPSTQALPPPCDPHCSHQPPGMLSQNRPQPQGYKPLHTVPLGQGHFYLCTYAHARAYSLPCECTTHAHVFTYRLKIHTGLCKHKHVHTQACAHRFTCTHCVHAYTHEHTKPHTYVHTCI